MGAGGRAMSYLAPLGDTLLGIVDSIAAQPQPGVVSVVEAFIDLPLEIGFGYRGGEVWIVAAPPHTRWQSGFLPDVHRAALTIALSSTEA
ncbi:hypothetical protein [Burkholderia ubonensis]|uniref:hypothetical protein n=1 Tax=Burkholderia ubonensis TaxID=101571 RepID=UPI0018DF610B|nr:hypothetical protein [Burkholderia ubonensis]